MDMEKVNNAGKKYWKKGLAAVVALALIGGVGVAIDIQQEKSEHAAKAAARSQLVAAQAARENVTLISEDEAKAKAAEAVGFDESALTFKNVNLENLAMQKDKKDKEDKREKKERKGGDKNAFTALHAGHDDRGHGYEKHDGYDHDGYDHDGYDHNDGDHRYDDQNHDGYEHDGYDHRMAPQGGMMGGQPGMMQGAPQGQPPMMQGQQPPQGASMAQADGDAQAQPQAAEQNSDATAQTQDQRPRPHFGFHPAYKIACTHGDVKYHVLVDATNGDVMMCDVA